MRELEALWSALPATAEWKQFRAHAPALERELARSLERLLTQDPRCPGDLPSRPSVGALAAEALLSVLEEWEEMPSELYPELWVLKQGVAALDASLDLLVASGAEPTTDREIRPASLVAGREERARWFEIAALANPLLGARDADEFSTGETREVLRDVEHVLTHLPELRRRAVTHRFLDGLTVDEVSLLLDISEDDVEIELAAGVKLIQLELQPA